MAREPEEGAELMLRRGIWGLEVAQPVHQVGVADGRRCLLGFRHRNCFELDAEDLGQGLHRVDIRLCAPLHIRHVVRARRRFGQRRMKGELVAQREG